MSRACFASLLALTLLAGCGGTKHAAPKATARPPATVAGRDRWGTVWLCRPGLARNPCTSDLTTTVVTRSGASHIVRSAPAANPRIDCFYVYPTVSMQKTANANLHVDAAEREVAVAQASRFSQVCRVFAPMYRQITLGSILVPGGINATDGLIAYTSTLAGFRDYLAHYNDGRGIVFIGHSQGASILIALLKREVDAKPAVRRRLVSALLLGGNVTVPKGRGVGGDFVHIPACRSRTQTGCVVAYSSFATTPPPDSKFGRVGTGLNPLAPGSSAKDLQILCVNPAAPGGGTASLDAYFPTQSLPRLGGAKVTTPWVAYPAEFTAACRSTGGATWLQVSRARGTPPDSGPRITQALGPTWGLHVVDVNLALGDLVALVRDESASYR